ncbi:hypothetical protein ACQY0O_007532 [Thecaphora frezii]
MMNKVFVVSSKPHWDLEMTYAELDKCMHTVFPKFAWSTNAEQVWMELPSIDIKIPRERRMDVQRMEAWRQEVSRIFGSARDAAGEVGGEVGEAAAEVARHL